MTTIVYKDGIMACDGRVTQGMTILYEDYSKIYTITGSKDTYVIGVAGALSQINAFIVWAMEDFDEEEKPKNGLEESSLADLTAIVVRKSENVVYTFEHDGFINFGNRDVSIGSGSEFAQAGMLLNLSAKGAVELASKMDCQTNDNIFSLVVEEEFLKEDN
jgi:ATP-dependent protease HslVU (ClpYQ) peptidase subunit